MNSYVLKYSDLQLMLIHPDLPKWALLKWGFDARYSFGGPFIAFVVGENILFPINFWHRDNFKAN